MAKPVSFAFSLDGDHRVLTAISTDEQGETACLFHQLPSLPTWKGVNSAFATPTTTPTTTIRLASSHFFTLLYRFRKIMMEFHQFDSIRLRNEASTALSTPTIIDSTSLISLQAFASVAPFVIGDFDSCTCVDNAVNSAIVASRRVASSLLELLDEGAPRER